MPLVDIELIEGVFDKEQKQEMIRRVTDAMVGIEGEAMRGVTWVRVREVASGEWAIGGQAVDRRGREGAAAEVRSLVGAARPARQFRSGRSLRSAGIIGLIGRARRRDA